MGWARSITPMSWTLRDPHETRALSLRWQPWLERRVRTYDQHRHRALAAVAGSPFSTGDSPDSTAVDPTGWFAYVLNQTDATGSSPVSIAISDWHCQKAVLRCARSIRLGAGLSKRRIGVISRRQVQLQHARHFEQSVVVRCREARLDHDEQYCSRLLAQFHVALPRSRELGAAALRLSVATRQRISLQTRFNPPLTFLH